MPKKMIFNVCKLLSLFLLLQNLLQAQDTLIVFKEKVSDFVVDNEENILAFFPENKVLKKFLAQYDSVVVFSEYDEIPLSEECKISLNTRQEIYLLDVLNSRLIVLSKDLRPLTAFYFEKNDLKGLPWNCEISQIATSIKGFLFLADVLARKIYVFDNFWNKIEEIETQEEFSKLLAFKNGNVVCVSSKGLYFPLQEKLIPEKKLVDAALYDESLFLLFPEEIFIYQEGLKRKIKDISKGFSRIFVMRKVFLLGDKCIVVF